MKTILSIPIRKLFTIPKTDNNLGTATFVRLDETKEQHKPNNSYCVTSNNSTYLVGKEYFIQHDINVIPV